MFSYRHYVPILKGKKGEFDALQSISKKTKQGITPLINIPPRKTDVPIEHHLWKIAKKIGNSWGFNKPLFIDLFNIDLSEHMTNGTQPVKYAFGCLSYYSVVAIPTTGLQRDDNYNQAITEIISKDQRGVCIRLLSEDIDNPKELDRELNNLLNMLITSKKDAHLLIDLQALSLEDIDSASKKIINLINTLQNISNWQTLTIAASGFPHSLSGIKPNSEEKIIRTELVLWKRVISSKNLARLPSYGDYGIVHPHQPEFDRPPNSSPKIRYTLNEDWLILRGESFKKHPKGFKQYHDLARNLIEMPEFLNVGFSKGDDYIVKCASFNATCGNLTTWIQVDTTHHLTLVSDQIASTVVP